MLTTALLHLLSLNVGVCLVVNQQTKTTAPYNLSPEKLIGLFMPRPTKPDALLFLHIPKNAGSSIAKAGWEQEKVRWGHAFDARMTRLPSGERCYKNHIPPSMLATLTSENVYAQAKDTFCTVQHPYDRMLSMYKFGIKNPEMSNGIMYTMFQPMCSPYSLNKFIQMAGQGYQKNQYSYGCTWFSQSDYIYGPDGRKWCNHILKMDRNLTRNFNHLMDLHNHSTRLTESDNVNTGKHVCPELTARDFSKKSKDMIDTIWPGDFQKLGYTREYQSLDLAFVHIPFNFGHTVEAVALYDEKILDAMSFSKEYGKQLGFSNAQNIRMGPPKVGVDVALALTSGRVAWGHMDADLNKINERTNCPQYFSPQKYWDKSTAEKVFGGKEVFGLLRDPYERLVSMFRGNIAGYGAMGDFHKTCDVNGGIAFAMTNILNGSSGAFASDCSFLPQADFFEGPHGITLPIDNRKFPDSVNDVFKQHGLKMHIRQKDIMQVSGCDNVWAADLDTETKGLVRKVYARDFALLCKHFGYCNDTEDTCLAHIEGMCPQKAFKWNGKEYIKKQ